LIRNLQIPHNEFCVLDNFMYVLSDDGCYKYSITGTMICKLNGIKGTSIGVYKDELYLLESKLDDYFSRIWSIHVYSLGGKPVRNWSVGESLSESYLAVGDGFVFFCLPK